MKRTVCVALACTLCLSLFAACSGGDGASSSAPQSASESSVVATSDSSLPVGPADSAGVEEILLTLSEAANLGGTITVSEIDLTANGLDTANVVAFAGAESKLSSENGGIVMVFEMQPGTTADMVAALEAYRDARAADDRYAEFAIARDNTADARIVEKGDVVIYAVSATGNEGGYESLDEAIAQIS